MSLSSFNSSLKDSLSLINNVKLLKSSGIKVINRDGVSQEFKTASQKSDYFKLYKSAISNFDYDVLLADDSIFQYSYVELNNQLPSIRYAYFQNPQEFKTYEEFLEFLREKNIIENETNEEIGDTFLEDYQQYLTEQNINASCTSIRYDLDSVNYRPLIHSASHLHIGHNNNIRIPCDKILTPLKFTFFVLKQVYYYQWKDLIDVEDDYILDCLTNVKTNCKDLDMRHWSSQEKKEIFLT